MSSKKKFIAEPEQMDAESDGESSDGDDSSNPDIYTGNEEIQVDFEGRNPIDSDYDGIKQLLAQLFLKAHINLHELTEIIIKQNYIGSVIKQSLDDDMIAEEEALDDDMEDSNYVFGVTSAINVTHHKEHECIQQLKAMILEKAEKSSTDATLKLLREILSNDSKITGFLLNERFINIPSQISVPMMENLCNEIKRATDKKMPYNFGYYVMILKFHRKEAKKLKPQEDIFANPEEETFFNQALASFEYSVEQEADTGLGGNWLEDDQVMKPYRKVCVIDGKKLPDIIESIKDFISS